MAEVMQARQLSIMEAVSNSALKNEFVIDQYRIYLKLEATQSLNIEAEHRQTKQLYKKENLDNKQVELLTNGFCQRAEDLFHLIPDVVAQTKASSSNSTVVEEQQGQKQINQTYRLEEKSNVLELHLSVSMGFGRLSTRTWSFVISLEKTEMDDMTRHERVIADLCRRVEQFERRFIPPLDQIRSLSNVKFCTSSHPTFTLSNNNKICTAIYNGSYGTGGELSVDQLFTSDSNDEILKISFTCTAGSVQYVYVGVKVGMTNNNYSVSVTSSNDAWFMNLQSGQCQQGSNSSGQCLCPVTLNEKVSIIVDVKKRKIGFVVNDDPDTWTFKLPKDTDITQLRPFIVMQSNGTTINIVDE